MGKIKVLVTDDSLLMQRVLVDLLKTDSKIEVVGTARNGEEAIQKIVYLNPDVVTMDIEMPKMDGLTAVKKIMECNPLPVIMISALTQKEAQLTFKALELGAVDYIPKPSGHISLNMDAARDELLFKVKTAATANLRQTKQPIASCQSEHTHNCDKVISIAASTGGPQALTHVLKALPVDVPPILIVQHMPKVVTRHFSEGLNETCKFSVKEARDGDRVEEGRALIAPGGFHMKVTSENRVKLTIGPPVNFVRPSADVLMISAAEVYGSKNVAVVLTGMGSDGANGIRAIKENGGYTIVQDEKTSVVFGMPKVAYQTGCVDKVVSLDKMPQQILKACN